MGTIRYALVDYDLPGVPVKTGPSPGFLKVRRRPPTSIVLHSTDGQAVRVDPNATVRDDAEREAIYQERHNREQVAAGAAALAVPFWVGSDGAVVQTFDPGMWWGWAQQQASETGIPIETRSFHGAQTPAALGSTVRLVELLTRLAGLPRTIPSQPGRGQHAGKANPPAGLGVWGHSDVYTGKGQGDPGLAIWRELRTAGYTPTDGGPGQRPPAGDVPVPSSTADPRAIGSTKPAVYFDLGRDPTGDEAQLLAAIYSLCAEERLELLGGTAVAYSVRDGALDCTRILARRFRALVPDAASIALFTGPSRRA